MILRDLIYMNVTCYVSKMLCFVNRTLDWSSQLLRPTPFDSRPWPKWGASAHSTLRICTHTHLRVLVLQPLQPRTHTHTKRSLSTRNQGLPKWYTHRSLLNPDPFSPSRLVWVYDFLFCCDVVYGLINRSKYVLNRLEWHDIKLGPVRLLAD